jgi:hypothetical protein
MQMAKLSKGSPQTVSLQSRSPSNLTPLRTLARVHLCRKLLQVTGGVSEVASALDKLDLVMAQSQCCGLSRVITVFASLPAVRNTSLDLRTRSKVGRNLLNCIRSRPNGMFSCLTEASSRNSCTNLSNVFDHRWSQFSKSGSWPADCAQLRDANSD